VDKKLSGRGVSTCATCDGFFFKGRRVAVVGGGDTALEEAIYLSKLASTWWSSTAATHCGLEGDAGQGDGHAERLVRLEHRGGGHQGRRQGRGHGAGAQEPTRPARPASWRWTACSSPSATRRTRRCQGPVALEDNGYIGPSDGSRTSVPGVFAAGDVQDHIYRQAVTAAGSGCMAAIDAERFLSGTGH
jgi:thioredoxin reductase (NADPH)